MRGHALSALHFIDNGVNEPYEFVIAVVDHEGTLHQVAGKSQEVAGFLNEFVSELSISQDEDGTYHLPPDRDEPLTAPDPRCDCRQFKPDHNGSFEGEAYGHGFAKCEPKAPWKDGKPPEQVVAPPVRRKKAKSG